LHPSPWSACRDVHHQPKELQRTRRTRVKEDGATSPPKRALTYPPVRKHRTSPAPPGSPKLHVLRPLRPTLLSHRRIHGMAESERNAARAKRSKAPRTAGGKKASPEVMAEASHTARE